jgi:outer membrane immunogenic protein
MKKLMVAAATLACAGSAQAADLAVKAPVYVKAAPAPLWDWSGIYVGANAGFGWGDTSWRSNLDTDIATAGESFATHPSGALAGGHIGINKQMGSLVLGAEFTGDWSGMKQTLGNSAAFPDLQDPTNAWTTKLRDLETLTARVGVAYDNWLFYGKGGGATGEVSLKGVGSDAVGTVLTFSESRRAWGGTAGAGIEYGLTRNIILGVEYDFTRLFPGGFSGNASGVAAGVPVTQPQSLGGHAFDVQTLTGRLSYKF